MIFFLLWWLSTARKISARGVIFRQIFTNTFFMRPGTLWLSRVPSYLSVSDHSVILEHNLVSHPVTPCRSVPHNQHQHQLKQIVLVFNVYYLDIKALDRRTRMINANLEKENYIEQNRGFLKYKYYNIFVFWSRPSNIVVSKLFYITKSWVHINFWFSSRDKNLFL